VTDHITFTPEPRSNWWEMLEGTHAIPTNIGNIYADASAARAGIEEVTGRFSYAKVTDNPVGIDHFAGDTFLPTAKVPANIYIFNTTP
jgi:hypothetical protein